jgi:hypothetical protein
VGTNIEEALVGHADFGRSQWITRRVVARYEFALDILGERLPRVGELVARLRADRARWERQVLRDPVVKRTIEDAIVRLEHDKLGSPDELEVVVELAATRLDRYPDLLPTQAEEGGGLRAGPAGLIWVPRFDAAAGPLTERMDRAFREEFLTYDEKSGNVHAGDAATAAKLGPACDLLAALLPSLGPDVLGHVAAVALVDAAGPRGRLLSASGGDGLPGVVALEPSQLDDPWDAAGRLLHEGLHLKLFDIMRCFSLVADPTASAQMPWRDVPWDLQRVLAAFHVYAHMVLYQAAVRDYRAVLSDRFGAPRDNAAVSHSTGSSAGYDDAAARARYLGEQLAGPLARHLTPDGRRLVGWLRSVVPFCDAPAGSSVETPGEVPGAVVPHRRAPDLRLRPVPDASCMFVFRPQDRTLHCLNLAAWSVFEVCRGQSPEELAADYAELMRPKLSAPTAERYLRQGLARLAEGGLIRPTALQGR